MLVRTLAAQLRQREQSTNGHKLNDLAESDQARRVRVFSRLLALATCLLLRALEIADHHSGCD